MKFKRIMLVAIFVAAPVFAFANYILRDPNGSIDTVFAFTCQTVNICPAHVIIDSSGNEKGIAANPVYVTVTGSPGDPCAIASGVQRSSVAIGVTSATVTQLVALASGKSIYVCGYSASLPTSATTAATFQFEYGTGTNCGTGTAALTGVFGAGYTTAGPPESYTSPPTNGSVISAPASNALCVSTAGTTVNLQGVLTYIQQ